MKRPASSSTPAIVTMPPLLLGVRSAAAAIDQSQRRIWDLIRDGSLRTVKPPGCRRVLIAREDLEALARHWREGS